MTINITIAAASVIFLCACVAWGTWEAVRTFRAIRRSIDEQRRGTTINAASFEEFARRVAAGRKYR